MRDNSAEILFQSFLQECPLFDVVHPEFPQPTTASPALLEAPEDGFGKAVVARDMPEPYEFLSLDNCQKNNLRQK